MKIFINLGKEDGERRKKALRALALERGYKYQGEGSIGKLVCALADGELGKGLLAQRTWQLDLVERVAKLPGWLQAIAIDACIGQVMTLENVADYLPIGQDDDESEGVAMTREITEEDKATHVGMPKGMELIEKMKWENELFEKAFEKIEDK